MQPEAIAARVWPGFNLHIEPLGGGITNRNYLVVVSGESFVLRVGGKDTALLGIDRRAEHEATRIAASLGIGPQVIAFLEPEGYLVTRFIEGRPLPSEELRQPKALHAFADTLRTFHTRAGFLRSRFDPFRVVVAYGATATAHGVALPREYEWAREVARRIEQARGPRLERPCHNDLLTANLVDDGTRIRIVDWEYAGMGDTFFDLANFSVNHALGDEEIAVLLTAYFGKLRESDEAALRLMRFMSDFREAMWAVVQQGTSDVDYDFRGHAAEHFERLERTAADPQFRAALGE